MHGARPLRSTRRLQNLTGVLPRWWRIENRAPDTTGPTLVSIYDEIGLYGVSAGDFLAEMRQIPGDIEMHINSPGGDVFDGIAIFNQLKQAQKRGTVHIVIDGLAASAASFIAQAASPGHLEMAPHAQMMIHDGFAMGIGNAADMMELADQLNRASDNIASIYADRTGKPAAYWRDMMRSETWFSDAEAVSIGLADRIQGDENNPANAWDLSIYDRWSAAGAVKNAGDGKTGKTGGKQIGDGWVMDPDGTTRFDPDGDDDSTPEGDTDNDYFDADGKQIKTIPPCPPMPDGGKNGKNAGKKAKADKKILDAAVDNSPWDAAKAWHNGTVADNPEAFYRGICAGKKTGDPATQNAWALPYKYHPDDPPNAAGVRNALARLGQTQGLLNKAEAQETLETAMGKINPDYSPGDQLDGGLLSAVFTSGLKGATT